MNYATSYGVMAMTFGADRVVFDKANTISMEVVIRNLGVKKMIAPELWWGLSVVWDGKEYERELLDSLGGEDVPTGDECYPPSELRTLEIHVRPAKVLARMPKKIEADRGAV